VALGAIAGGAAQVVDAVASGASGTTSAATDATLRVLGAAAAAMAAIAAAVADGVNLQGEQMVRQLDLLKNQLAAKDLQNISYLLIQVLQLAQRDVPRALQTMNQIIDALKAAVSAATIATYKNPLKTLPPSPGIATTLSAAPTQPLLRDDMVDLSQRLSRLESALAARRAMSTAGWALQRVRLTLGQSAMLVIPTQPIVLPTALKR